MKDADLQKTIEKSTSETSAPAARTVSAPAPPRSRAQQSLQKTVNGISFQLLECKATGSGVTCNFILTSVGQEDRLFELNLSGENGSAVLIDDQSNEYRSSGGSFGLLSGDNYYSLTNTLVPPPGNR